MTPEVKRYLAKARKCLSNARSILAIGIGDDAGRGAYMAGFHAAQAFIFDTTGKAAKTHNGVQALFVDLARKNPNMPPDLITFLSGAYHLKAVADYEMGEGSSVPIEKAAAAIETAERFINCIEGVLETPSDHPTDSADS